MIPGIWNAFFGDEVKSVEDEEHIHTYMDLKTFKQHNNWWHDLTREDMYMFRDGESMLLCYSKRKKLKKILYQANSKAPWVQLTMEEFNVIMPQDPDGKDFL